MQVPYGMGDPNYKISMGDRKISAMPQLEKV